ncbi:MAG: hypothetical protein GDA45_05115 [Chromatiales bacterium]|nr:hypothetical protein [Chromatiales bacterium]
MPISAPSTTSTVTQAQPLPTESATGNFGARLVSNSSSPAGNIEQHQTGGQSMSPPRAIATIHIRQPGSAEVRQHFMTDPRLGTDYRDTTLHSQESIDQKTNELARFSTSVTHLKNYIDISYQENRISDQSHDTLSTLANYNQVLDKNIKRMTDLADKVDRNKASSQDLNELNGLFKSHKNNLSVVQAHLSHLIGKGALSPEEKALTGAFAMRFAERQMDLAELTSLYSDLLPEQEPVSRGERIDYHLMQARGCLRAFEKMAGQTSMSAARHTRIKEALEQHCAKLEQFAKFNKGEYNPEEDSLSLDLLTEDFSLVEDEKKPKYKNSVLAPLQRRWDQFSDFSGPQNPGPIPLMHPKISQNNMIQLFLAHQFKAAGVQKADMPKLSFLCKQGIISEVNNREWPQINKTLTFKVGGKEHTGQSTITPGGHIAANHFDKGYSGNGITSMDRLQYKHAPNMAHSQMTDENGEVLFSGIRHGILDPFNIKAKNLSRLPTEQVATMVKDLLVDTGAIEIPEGEDPWQYSQTIAQQAKAGKSKIADLAGKLRTEASKMMATDLLKAAVASDPAKLQAGLRGEEVAVSLNSVSLVTPDHLTSFVNKRKNEKVMLAHQTDSLQGLAKAKQPIVIKLKDQDGDEHEVVVRPKVRTFNFGVNLGAVATKWHVFGPRTPFWGRLMGWELAASKNNPQLNDLLGDPRSREPGGEVANKINQMDASDDPAVRQKASLLRQAATQAKAIWNSQSFRRGGVEPYKMVSRLALISHLMGETTLYNCKSGKDRTGQLDAEVKYLAAVGNATGQIPEPETEPTDESRSLRSNFALNTGNHEMQQMSTGLKGYKLKGVPGLEKMLGADMMDIYRGGSGFVKA